jgi:hypothetical protein
MADEKTFTKATSTQGNRRRASPRCRRASTSSSRRTTELIGENRKLKRGRDQARGLGRGRGARRQGREADSPRAQKAAKDATAAAEKATKALETEQGFTQKLLIQDGLKSALIANGVKDEDFIDSLSPSSRAAPRSRSTARPARR